MAFLSFILCEARSLRLFLQLDYQDASNPLVCPIYSDVIHHGTIESHWPIFSYDYNYEYCSLRFSVDKAD